jgi:putative transposase
MSRNYYAEIHLHVVWHTKESLPLLTPEVEAFVHTCLRGRILPTPGLHFHAVGGTETHVHLALAVPPTVLVSELVGQLKGSSAHEANGRFGAGGKALAWQDGYGVVSFGTRNLEWVKRYIQNQRQHHARGTLHGRLERATGPEQEDRADPEPDPTDPAP